MKHFHMLMAGLTVLLFMHSSYAIFTKKPLSKIMMAISHVIYFLVVLTGGYLLVLLSRAAGVQHWAYAKIVLLVVAILAMIKARRTPKATLMGIATAWVALFGILVLAFTKPIL